MKILRVFSESIKRKSFGHNLKFMSKREANTVTAMPLKREAHMVTAMPLKRETKTTLCCITL